MSSRHGPAQPSPHSIISSHNGAHIDNFILVSIMGVVEGLTEFLPVSSTGHLIIVGHLLNYTGKHTATFEIVIQFGAILAVIIFYWRRFIGLLTPETIKHQELSGLRGLWLLLLTSLPASLLGLFTYKAIKLHLFNPMNVAMALVIGGAALFIVEALPRRERVTSVDDINSAMALGIGLFQCLALWPGFSRAGSTIMGAMILGADRKTAAEYSFLAAVPILAAATLYDLYRNWEYLDKDDLSLIALGFVISFIAAWGAVKGLIYLLGHMTLRPFAWYRLILAMAIWLFWS
ncbi:Undecaprenyl-diphosphatase [Desulfovibrionales bacterium]